MIVLLRFSPNRIEEVEVKESNETLEVIEKTGIIYVKWEGSGEIALPKTLNNPEKVKFLLQKHKVDGLPYYVRAV